MSPGFFAAILFLGVAMSQETLRMSRKERQRLVVMHRVESGEMLLKEAA